MHNLARPRLEAKLTQKSRPEAGAGKQVGDVLYLHIEALGAAPLSAQSLVKQAFAAAPSEAGDDFNVVKLDLSKRRVSLLKYPGFFTKLFPELERSCQIDLERGEVTHKSYAQSQNPPILHRKDLLLPLDDPRRKRYEAITRILDDAGLFQSAYMVGHRIQWEHRLALAGFEVHGDSLACRIPPVIEGERPKVLRHRTAIRRFTLSSPFQLLSRAGLLNGDLTVLDFGCGYGDDVRSLVAAGVQASGWDPHFRPDSKVEPADIVNLGFVLNVIEDARERSEVLRSAHQLARKLLIVSVLKNGASQTPGRTYGDGVVTKRQTFQKTYTQDELRAFVSGVLHAPVISATPGIVIVPKCEEIRVVLETSRQDWLSTEPSGAWLARRAECQALRAAREDCVGRLWEIMLDLGRPPTPEELDQELSSSITDVFGSLERAVRFARRTQDHREYEGVREDRKAELLAELAVRLIGGARKLSSLPRDLQRDIRDFFGSFRSAAHAAKDTLHQSANTDALCCAFRQAEELRLGIVTPRGHFIYHAGNLPRLPVVLQVLVACSRVLVGAQVRSDLTKINPEKPKITFTALDDFDGKPLPLARQKVRVDMSRSNVHVSQLPLDRRTPVLVRKSLFLEPESLGYGDQVRTEELIRDRLGLDSNLLWYPNGILTRGLSEEGLLL